MHSGRRASLEPNTTSLKKFPAFFCSKTYTVWTSQQIVAEPEKIPIILGVAAAASIVVCLAVLPLIFLPNFLTGVR